MEERKNHPSSSSSSLPSNYVTLAQLQERWLKQQNQPQPQHQEPPEQNHQEQPHKEEVIAPRNGNASRSQPPQKQCVVKKNRNHSKTCRRATTEVVASSDDQRKSEVVARTGDETVSKSKKDHKRNNRKVNRKPKTEERGEASGTAAPGKKEAEKKATIENELKDKKNGGSVTVEVVEQSVRVLSINSGNAKQNGRMGKMNKGFGHSQFQNGEAQGKNEEAEKKATIQNELKEKKKNGGSVTVEQVEQSVRVLSINSGNAKQNGRLGKMNNGFRHSQSQRKKRYGEARYGYGNRTGQQHYKAGVQRTENRMVWVKKDEIVG